MLLFSNAEVKRRVGEGGGKVVDGGEAGGKSGRDGGKKKKKKKKRRECSLGRRNKAASECSGGWGRKDCEGIAH